jgi:hypothetical protein
MNKNSISEKIAELFELYKSGALTKEEYDLLKSELLTEVNPPITKDRDTIPPIIKDRDTIITEGIAKAISGEYKEVIHLLTPILDINKSENLLHNRGALFLTYCLCESKETYEKISKRFATIDFKILKQNYLQSEEQILLKITEYVVKSRLSQINSYNSDVQLERLADFFMNNEYYTENSNSQLANIWYSIGTKQVELKLYASSLNSIEMARNLMPDEIRYKNKYVEIENLIQDKKQKRKRIIKVTVKSTVVLLIAIAVSFYAYTYFFQEKNAFELAKKENTLRACLSYLNEYPNGKYSPEIKLIQEEANWCEIKMSHSIASYKSYLLTHPHGKHFQEANDSLLKLKFDINRKVQGRYFLVTNDNNTNAITKQYIEFDKNGKCNYLKNNCNEYGLCTDYYTIKDDMIYLYHSKYVLSLKYDNTMVFDIGINDFTCGNHRDGDRVYLIEAKL